MSGPATGTHHLARPPRRAFTRHASPQRPRNGQNAARGSSCSAACPGHGPSHHPPQQDRVRHQPPRGDTGIARLVEFRHGHQRLRPLQDRHRPVELAHGRADAGRRQFADALAADGVLGGVARVQRRAVRLARRHRAGPRQRQGGDARPRGRGAGDGRPGGRRAAWSPAVRETGTLPCSAKHEIALRPSDATRLSPPPAAAAPPERHALHRLRRARTASSRARRTTRSAAASSSTRTRPAADRDRAGRHAACRIPFRSGDELLAAARRRAVASAA